MVIQKYINSPYSQEIVDNIVKSNIDSIIKDKAELIIVFNNCVYQHNENLQTKYDGIDVHAFDCLIANLNSQKEIIDMQIATYQMLKENLIIQNKHDEEYTNS